MVSYFFNEEDIFLQSGINHITIFGSVSMVTKISDSLSASGKPGNKGKIQIKIRVSDFLALNNFSEVSPDTFRGTMGSIIYIFCSASWNVKVASTQLILV